MTRKDYVLIAKAMADARPLAADRIPFYASARAMGAVDAWENTVAIIGRALQADNPRFDAARFVAACNEGGPVCEACHGRKGRIRVCLVCKGSGKAQVNA